MARTTVHATGNTDWDALPELMLLDEVVAITRHAPKTAYGLLSRAQFPIGHLPHVRPYRFRKNDVRVWVEHGTVTNKALAVQQRRRGKAA